jgi:DNA end-binding protein Ku
VRGGALVLEQLRFDHEVRRPEGLAVPGRNLKALAVRDKELELAEQLVEGLSGEFHPEDFRDEYLDDILALIEKKIRTGKTAVIEEPEEAPEEEPHGTEVADLLKILRQSVDATKKTSPRRRAKPKHRVGKE